MLDNLVSLFGGRVAEAIALGDISTGASNDLQRATEICRDMVTKYGMTDEVGPVVYDDGNVEYYDAKKHSILENKKRYYLKRRMLRQLAHVKHLFTK